MVKPKMLNTWLQTDKHDKEKEHPSHQSMM